MAWLEEIITRLQDQSVGTLDDDIFGSSKSALPPLDQLSADKAYVRIFDTGGMERLRRHGSEYQRPSASIITSARTKPVAYAKAVLAYNALHGVVNTTIGGTFYLYILARQSEPADIGPDSGRMQYSFTIDALKYVS